MSKHLSKVHGRRFPRDRQKPTSPANIQRLQRDVVDRRAPDLIQPSVSDEYQAERSLDATRDYYRFRENGRFGSHSMHDDFGDESGS